MRQTEHQQGPLQASEQADTKKGMRPSSSKNALIKPQKPSFLNAEIEYLEPFLSFFLPYLGPSSSLNGSLLAKHRSVH